MSSFSHPLHFFIIRANLSHDKTLFSVQEVEVRCYLHRTDGIHRVMCESHVCLCVFSPCFALLTCWQRIQQGQNQSSLCFIFLTRTLVPYICIGKRIKKKMSTCFRAYTATCSFISVTPEEWQPIKPREGLSSRKVTLICLFPNNRCVSVIVWMLNAP